ncbi:hypothetical protein DPMN_012747 [Dreissena polymorpha]|uniref:Uncharacterized protein n=1 Tax=Dreissena polymorpha TaxID=45954 RepID=A0A9D4K0E1_DREPO|nr:hypothetical protein DPMN_128668 [Dreissena polymorpha]KAH3888707.1 hypothetical protein DPMN_012747 [Dreissena polymorpha]
MNSGWLLKVTEGARELDPELSDASDSDSIEFARASSSLMRGVLLVENGRTSADNLFDFKTLPEVLLAADASDLGRIATTTSSYVSSKLSLFVSASLLRGWLSTWILQ